MNNKDQYGMPGSTVTNDELAAFGIESVTADMLNKPRPFWNKEWRDEYARKQKARKRKKK